MARKRGPRPRREGGRRKKGDVGEGLAKKRAQRLRSTHLDRRGGWKRRRETEWKERYVGGRGERTGERSCCLERWRASSTAASGSTEVATNTGEGEVRTEKERRGGGGTLWLRHWNGHGNGVSVGAKRTCGARERNKNAQPMRESETKTSARCTRRENDKGQRRGTGQGGEGRKVGRRAGKMKKGCRARQTLFFFSALPCSAVERQKEISRRLALFGLRGPVPFMQTAWPGEVVAICILAARLGFAWSLHVIRLEVA